MSKSTFNYVKAFTKVFNDNPTPFKHDRTKSVGASETFGCIRENWFKKNITRGFITDWGYMERGNAIENYYVIPYLRKIFGEENCLYMGDDQDTLFDGNASSTSDGLVINQPKDILSGYGVDDIGSGDLVIEVKSFDERANVYSEKPIHRGQIIMQMGMFRKNTDYQPNWGQVVYVNSSDFRDIRPFTVKFNQSIYDRGLSRSDQVMEADDPHELKPEGKFTGSCEYCDFHDECGEASLTSWDVQQGKEIKDEETLDAIGRMIQKISDLKDGRVENEAAEKELKHDLKELLLKNKVGRVDKPNEWLVSVSKIAGRGSLDKEKLEKDLGISLADYQKKSKGYTTLRITDRKHKK